MPRLSLWKPNKGNDYRFADRIVREHFLVGGTGVFVHKLLGTHAQTDSVSSDQPTNTNVSPTNVQDLLFLENNVVSRFHSINFVYIYTLKQGV